MTDNETKLKAWKYAVIENIATIMASCLGAYFISPWCFLLMANINYLGTSDSNVDHSEK